MVYVAAARRECAERLCCLPQLPCSALGASGDTIIVGVDGTERSRDALALAELLAGTAGGRLLIAHVHNYGQLEGLEWWPRRG
jgi:hypothetical protein